MVLQVLEATPSLSLFNILHKSDATPSSLLEPLTASLRSLLPSKWRGVFPICFKLTLYWLHHVPLSSHTSGLYKNSSAFWLSTTFFPVSFVPPNWGDPAFWGSCWSPLDTCLCLHFLRNCCASPKKWRSKLHSVPCMGVHGVPVLWQSEALCPVPGATSGDTQYLLHPLARWIRASREICQQELFLSFLSC